MEKKKVICPGCSISCDDIYLQLENGKINHVLNTCLKGFAKFSRLNKNRLDKYYIMKYDMQKEVHYDQSIEFLITHLKNAKKTLFLLGKNATLEDISNTFMLAEKVKGIVSCPGAQLYLNFFRKLKLANIEIPTYEEMINLVDTMVFWGTNPSATHLRHASKFSVLTRGEKITKGKEDRFVVMIDVRKTEIRVLTDEFIQLKSNQDIELINIFLDLVNAKEVDSVPFDYPVKDLVQINKYFQKSDEIVFFIGDGFLMNPMDTIDKFIELVLLLKNKGLNVKILPMVETSGINNYISIVSEKYEEKNSMDFAKNSEIKILIDDTIKDIDLIVYLDYDPIANLPFNSIKDLLKKRSIQFGTKKSWISMIADLLIPISEPFIESSGTGKRLDFTEVTQDKIIEHENSLKALSEILNSVIKQL